MTILDRAITEFSHTYLQVQMGHSDIKTTLNTYAHLIEKNRQDRLREIEKKIADKKNDGHNSVTET